MTENNSTSTQLAPIPVMTGSLDSYISAVNQIAVLSKRKNANSVKKVFMITIWKRLTD